MNEGTRLALLLWAKDEHGEDDVVMIVGDLIEKDGVHFLLFDGQGSPLEIRDEWIERIRPTPPDFGVDVDGAKFLLSLSVGKSEDIDGPLEKTGLRWPE